MSNILLVFMFLLIQPNIILFYISDEFLMITVIFWQLYGLRQTSQNLYPVKLKQNVLTLNGRHF